MRVDIYLACHKGRCYADATQSLPVKDGPSDDGRTLGVLALITQKKDTQENVSFSLACHKGRNSANQVCFVVLARQGWPVK